MLGDDGLAENRRGDRMFVRCASRSNSPAAEAMQLHIRRITVAAAWIMAAACERGAERFGIAPFVQWAAR